jgi:VIT1/CCC1 family predicted Fe2+/Mn2+ transporter
MTEKHKTEHIGWLRAAVLGANDGFNLTTSSGCDSNNLAIETLA